MTCALAGGRGRGSGGRSKQSAAAASAQQAAIGQDHERNADASPSAPHTNGSDILEELPLAERLAERQHRSMLADAASGSSPTSAAGDQSELAAAQQYQFATATHQYAPTEGKSELQLLGSTAAKAQDRLPVAGMSDATVAAAAAVPAIARVAQRPCWVRARPQQPAVATDAHLHSPAGPRSQQDNHVVRQVADMAESNLPGHAGDTACFMSATAALAIQTTMSAEAGQQLPEKLAQQVQQQDAGDAQHTPDVPRTRKHPEPPHLAFLIDIDDSPAPAKPFAPETAVSDRQYPSAPLSEHHADVSEPLQPRPEPSKEGHAVPTVGVVSLVNNQGSVSAVHPDAHLSHVNPHAPLWPTGFSSPSLGPVMLSEEMTVPDTPPYSSGSAVMGPGPGPSWLSPLLARQQPEQSQQYSPSMLGRPPAIHLSSASAMHAPAVEFDTLRPIQPGSDRFGAQAHTEPVLPGLVTSPLFPLHPNTAAADLVPVLQPCTTQQQQQHPPAPSTRPKIDGQHAGDSPPCKDEGRVEPQRPVDAESPGEPVVAAATGVFAEWDSQEAAVDAAQAAQCDGPDPAPSSSAVTQPVVPNAEDQKAGQLAQKTAQTAERPASAMPEQLETVLTTQMVSKPQSSAAADHQVVPEATQPAPCSVPKGPAASLCAAPEAASMPTADRKHEMPRTVMRNQSTTLNTEPQDIGLPAVVGNNAVASSLTGRSQNSNANNDDDDVGMHDGDTSWDWHQSQDNLGYQDAFAASQAFGTADNWADLPQPAWKRRQAEADKPFVINRLPVKAQTTGHRAPTVAEDTALLPSKHVPFTNRRIAVPIMRPKALSKQAGAALALLEESQALPVRNRPLLKHASGLKPGKPAQKLPAGQISPSVSATTGTAVPVRRTDTVQLGQTHQGSLPGRVARELQDKQSAHTVAAEASGQSPDTARDGVTAATTTSNPQTTAAVADAWTQATAAATTKGQVTAATHSSRAPTAVADGGNAETIAAAQKGDTDPTAASGRAHGTAAADKCTCATIVAPTAGPATATSPAAAIFGPHIAENLSSQSQVRKKLCLRLAPRQPDTVPAPAVPVTANPSGQINRLEHDSLRGGQHDTEQRPPASATINDKAAANAAASTSRQAVCADHDVLSPLVAHASLPSPEAATPAGKFALSTPITVSLCSCLRV